MKEKQNKKPLMFGKVKEVTELSDKVLMPLSPVDNRSTHFFATIIYDLTKLGYVKKDFEFYFKDFLKNNSVKKITGYIESNNRMTWKSVKPFDSAVEIKDLIRKGGE